MDALELNSRHKNFRELSQFHLADDDAYDIRCGEVYITINRVLVFHCSLCDNRYGSFVYFLEHLSALHYKDIQEEVIEIDTDTEGSEIETNPEFLDYNSYDETGQSLDEEYDEILQKAKIESEHNFEEQYLEEVEALEMLKTADYVEGLENFDLDKIKEEIGIEEQSSPRSSIKNDMDEFESISEVFKCDKCNKMFKCKSRLQKHLITHSNERKHKCKICGFAFKERSNLNSHLRRHSGLKKISCELCPKKFFTRTEADTHQRTHTGERPYICFYCGAAYGTSGALNEHVKRHNNIRPHKCPHCDKSFYDSCQLRDHMPVHTNERPFVCAVCSASFARRKALRVHTKLHINAKEYKCNLCEKSFNQKPALLAHVKTNHKVVDSN